MSDETLDVAGVKAKFGVPPERIVDYLTLIGDAVDNVPGVDKVGPKTAVKWIAEYGSLDGVMADADSDQGRASARTCARRSTGCRTGRKLVTVRSTATWRPHVPGWPDRWTALALARGRREALLALLQRATASRRCKRELDEAPAPRAEQPANGPRPCRRHVDDRSALERRSALRDRAHARSARRAGSRKLRAAPLTALDTETDFARPDAGPHRRHVVRGRSRARPPTCRWRTATPARRTSCRATTCWRRLKPWLEDAQRAQGRPARQVRPHVFANHGIAVRGYAHDTLLQSYVLEAHQPHGLDSLAERHLGRKRPRATRTSAARARNQIPFAQVDVRARHASTPARTPT